MFYSINLTARRTNRIINAIWRKLAVFQSVVKKIKMKCLRVYIPVHVHNKTVNT